MILSTDLKRVVKQLAAIQSKDIYLGNGQGIATDGDMGVKITCEYFTGLGYAVDARLFSSICGKLTKDVNLGLDGNKLVIKSAKLKAELPVVFKPAPTIPTASSLSELEIPSEYLSKMLSYVSQVTDEKVSYDHTGAVRLLADATGLDLTATDNLRIAHIADGLKYPNFDPVLIPAKVLKAVKELTGTITLGQSESGITFEAGNVLVYTRKLTKKFPDIVKVMPKSYKLEAVISTKSLAEALSNIGGTIDPETDSKVILSVNRDVLKVTSGNSMIGQTEDELGIETVVPGVLDDPYLLTLGANARFLNTYLTTIKESGTITFKANESGKPFMLESGNRKMLMAGVRI